MATPLLTAAACALTALAGAQATAPERQVQVGRVAGEVARFGPNDTAMAWLPSGSARIGCSANDADCFDDERPARTVTFERGFWISLTEVTIADYRAFARATGAPMAPRPSFSQGDDHPVVNVTADEAAAFCAWLGGRLPSEAEWEYAARGGLEAARFPWGDAPSRDQANYDGVEGRDRWTRTSPVGSLAANGYGLFDVAGNVWEWTSDSLAQAGVEPGAQRIVRGGSFSHPARSMRVSNRGKFAPAGRVEFIGFRCVRDEQAGQARPAPTPTAPPAATPAPTPAPSAPPQPFPTQVPITPPPAPTAAPAATPLSDSRAAGERRVFTPSGAEMVWIPGGTFEMGAVRGDGAGFADEQPRHDVTLSRGFWMDATEVTFGRYRRFAEATGAVMPYLPNWADDQHPVVKVRWQEAVAYCRWAGGRLPTEAEWERAARAGAQGLKYPWGDEITHDHANFDATGGRDAFPKSSPAGAFAPNAWGLYDLAGNVWEWTADFYGERYYASSPSLDPAGPEGGRARVVRGGCWTSDPGRLRSSYRFSLDPTDSQVSVGFRCVRDEP